MSLSAEAINDALKKHKGKRAAARALGVPYSTLWHAMRADASAFTSRLTVNKVHFDGPKRGVKRFIFSCAQAGASVNEPFLRNLEAYAEDIGAKLYIGGITYNQQLGHKLLQAKDFDPRLQHYMTFSQLNIADKLIFCGEINTSPTATRPLMGFETYTRSKWGIFPHPRICLDSIATMFHEPSKIIMTTGAVTEPNYLHRKAGAKAEFHHVIGAVVVEVDKDGDIFCRHLIAEDDGSFQDLDVRVEDGDIWDEQEVAAITWGDIHTERLDISVERACWAPGGMLDTLRPDHQFFHDTMDFSARSHHNIHDPHKRFETFIAGEESVEGAIEEIAQFLTLASRDWCTSVVVESNHDKMLMRWLREGDYKLDTVNALFFLDCQLRVYRAMAAQDESYNLFAEVLVDKGAPYDTVFLKEDASYRICGGKIECAIHGHKGANGAKGHINSFAKMGPKANVGHTHSAAIYEGIYQAGTSSLLDLGYNNGGLSSWNHSHIVTYPSGKRTIVTMQNGKWRA